MEEKKSKDCNYPCQTDPLNIITRRLACTPGMGVSRCYEDHWQAPPNLRWLDRGEWQGTMGSCVTKKQTADCQMMEEPITYTWNQLYVPQPGEDEEASANIELHLAQEWFHGKLGAGRSGRHITERLLMEHCTKMGALMAPLLSGRARHLLGTTFCPSGTVRRCGIAPSTGGRTLTATSSF